MESRKIVQGIKWAGIQFALDTLFRFCVRLLLAKLLLPKFFGLVGMCVIFIALAGVASELGMGAALIQKKEDFEAEKLYSTAFWSGLVWGLILYIIMSFLIAPFTSYFYNEPQLKKLIPVLSLVIVLKPLIMIQTIILTRRMDFKNLAKISNIATITSGIIALLCAYYGLGVWALVINNILSIIITIPLFIFSVKWIPKIEWKKNFFLEIFGFGAYSTVTSVFSTLTYNIDNLMIGKMLGSSQLGSYTLSFSLTENLRQIISNVLNKVMYPVFGKNQDNKEKLKAFFTKIIRFNAILMYPIMAFIFMFSNDIIIGFFGKQWVSAIMPLKILSIAMMLHLLVNSFTSLIRGLGKPLLEMKIIIGITLFVLLPGLYIGISNFGLVGASYAILLNKIALVIIGLFVLKREIGLNFIDVFKAVKNAIIAVLVSVILILITIYVLKINYFFISVFIFMISYAICIYKLEGDNLSLMFKTLLKRK